jgi:hypothetical protein
LKYNHLNCFLHSTSYPLNAWVFAIDLDGNRKMLPTKSFPGAAKWTKENLFPNDAGTVKKLSRMGIA